jgi:hypothetical protein
MLKRARRVMDTVASQRLGGAWDLKWSRRGERTTTVKGLTCISWLDRPSRRASVLNESAEGRCDASRTGSSRLRAQALRAGGRRASVVRDES